MGYNCAMSIQQNVDKCVQEALRQQEEKQAICKRAIPQTSINDFVAQALAAAQLEEMTDERNAEI